MADLNSSPTNEKPNLDVLFPELKKTDTALPAPRFMAPAAAAATLLKGAAPSSRPVPPPPSLRGSKPTSVRPPPPSARAAQSETVEEVGDDELIASAPAHLEPIRPVDDDDTADESPTIAISSPLPSVPRTVRPIASAPRAPIPAPPPSRRAAPPPSAAKLPPLPSAPQLARPSAPSAAKLPPMPTPPPSLRSVPPPSAPVVAAPVPPVYTENEVESMAPLPSRPKVGRAAASLVASTKASSAYVPPSVLPPAAQPISGLETTQVNRAHSLIPTAASVPPPAVEAQRSRSGLVALLAVGSLALLGGLGFAAVKGGAALGLGAPASGALAITVAGPGGAKLNGLKVLVDGVVKCEAAPCTLTALSAGTHFVSAEAPGYASTAARAVSVERNGESALHIELAPSAAPAPAANAAPAAKAEAQATSLSELRPEESARTAPSTAKADRPAEKLAKADKKETKQDDAKKAVAEDAAGQGTLNINSIPMASVVLDGRPVGSTPLVGLKVSPGPHSVVFIHPEHGRKSSGTTVKAGATATVAVRF